MLNSNEELIYLSKLLETQTAFSLPLLTVFASGLRLSDATEAEAGKAKICSLSR